MLAKKETMDMVNKTKRKINGHIVGEVAKGVGAIGLSAGAITLGIFFPILGGAAVILGAIGGAGYFALKIDEI